MKKIALSSAVLSSLLYAEHIEIPIKTFSNAIKEYKVILKEDSNAIFYTNIYGTYVIKTNKMSLAQKYPNYIYSVEPLKQPAYIKVLTSSTMELERDLLWMFRYESKEVYIQKRGNSFDLVVEGLDTQSYKGVLQKISKKYGQKQVTNKEKLPEKAKEIKKIQIEPVFKVGDVSTVIEEDTKLEIDLTLLTQNTEATYPDSLEIKSIKSESNNGQIVEEKGNYTFIPAQDYSGDVELTFELSNKKETKSASLKLNVTPVNDLPIANDDKIKLTESSKNKLNISEILANDSDKEGPLRIVGFTNLNNLTVSSENGKVYMEPKSDYLGAASFGYVVEDSDKARAEAKVDVEIVPFTPYTRALKYYNEKEYQKSLEIFDKLFLEDLTNTEYSFYIGLNYFGLKLYDEAIAAYDRVLIIEPNSIRTQLELAKTYFFMKKYNTSEKEFRDILTKDIPEPVRNNVLKYLVLIESYKKNHFLGGVLIGGMLYDTNATTGNADVTGIPDDEVTDVVGDFADQEIAILNYKYRLTDDIYIKNDTMVFNKNNFTQKTYNIFMASDTLSVESTIAGHTLNLGLYADTLNYGTSWLMYKYAVYPKHTMSLGGGHKLNTNFKYELKKAFSSVASATAQAIDANYYELNTNLTFLQSKEATITGSMLVSTDIMDTSSYSNGFNVKYGLSSGYNYKLDKKLSLAGKFTYKNINYYKIGRNDQQYTPAITANYMDYGLMFSANITYMINSSTSDANSYNKLTVGGTVIFPFTIL